MLSRWSIRGDKTETKTEQSPVSLSTTIFEYYTEDYLYPVGINTSSYNWLYLLLCNRNLSDILLVNVVDTLHRYCVCMCTFLFFKFFLIQDYFQCKPRVWGLITYSLLLLVVVAGIFVTGLAGVGRQRICVGQHLRQGGTQRTCHVTQHICGYIYVG